MFQILYEKVSSSHIIPFVLGKCRSHTYTILIEKQPMHFIE